AKEQTSGEPEIAVSDTVGIELESAPGIRGPHVRVWRLLDEGADNWRRPAPDGPTHAHGVDPDRRLARHAGASPRPSRIQDHTHSLTSRGREIVEPDDVAVRGLPLRGGRAVLAAPVRMRGGRTKLDSLARDQERAVILEAGNDDAGHRCWTCRRRAGRGR